MSFEGDLRASALADAGLAAIVGRRIDWNERPQGAALPGVMLNRITAGRSYAMRGRVDLEQPLVQADLDAASVDAALALRDAFLAFLDGLTTAPFTCALVEGERHDFSPVEGPKTSQVQRVSLDVRISWKPAA